MICKPRIVSNQYVKAIGRVIIIYSMAIICWKQFQGFFFKTLIRGLPIRVTSFLIISFNLLLSIMLF